MEIMRVEKNQNYTVMANAHLKDPNLSLRAVGLLSRILSLPDDWDLSVRGLIKICKEGRDCVYKTIGELEQAGYIERRQIRGDGGTFRGTEFIVYELPHLQAKPESPEDRDFSPRPENPEAVKKETASPYPENPDTVKPDTDSPYPVNPPQLSTKGTKERNETKEKEKDNDYHPKKTTGQLSREDRERYRRLLTEKLRPAGLKKLYPDSRKTVDSFIEIAFRAVTTSKKTLRIGGEELPADDVRQRLLSLTDEHLEQVLKAWEMNSTNVRNPRQYMLTMLYNAPMSIDAKQKTDQTAAPPVTLDELKAVLDRM